MEEHAAKNIQEVSESEHALEDAEKILEEKLEAGEFEAAGKVFSEVKTLEIHCNDNGFDQEAGKWSEIAEKFREKAREILDEKMEECRSDIEDAEQIEDKVHSQMANHEAAEGISGSPVTEEFKAVNRNLNESKQDIEDIISIANDFGLEDDVKEDAQKLKHEWREAKRTLQKLQS